MPRVSINRERCKGCLLCMSFCSKGLITVDKKLNRKGVAPVKCEKPGECLGCMMCVIVCPDCCIKVEHV